MAAKYKIRRQEAVDALASALIPTAVELAKRAAVSRTTAQTVLRGGAVSRATAVHVMNAINKNGGHAVLSEVFEEATE